MFDSLIAAEAILVSLNSDRAIPPCHQQRARVVYIPARCALTSEAKRACACWCCLCHDSPFLVHLVSGREAVHRARSGVFWALLAFDCAPSHGLRGAAQPAETERRWGRRRVKRGFNNMSLPVCPAALKCSWGGLKCLIYRTRKRPRGKRPCVWHDCGAIWNHATAVLLLYRTELYEVSASSCF